MLGQRTYCCPVYWLDRAVGFSSVPGSHSATLKAISRMLRRLTAGAVWWEGGLVGSEVVTYRVDDATTVQFEVDAVEGFRPAGAGEVLARVREAAGPAVEAARAVLEKVKEAGPDRVEIRFGIKASGGASWLVARAAGEANFDVTLSWERGGGQRGAGAAGGPGSGGE